MSSSGLIFVAIAIMWAAVLIPMWLRNHDSASENRSADRFGQAMRILSRQDGAEDSDEADQSAERPAERQPQPRTRSSLARRRVRTLLVLLSLTLVLAAVAVVGLLPAWAPLPAALLLVGFVVHLRSQAKRSAAVRARRRAPREAFDPTVEKELVRSNRTVTERSERPSAEFVPGPSKAMVVETKGSSRLADSEDADQQWRPNPLPVPTYVTAPKAIRPIKVIDLTTPGAFSSGRFLDDETAADEDLLAADVAADELDALLEHEARGPAADPTTETDAARRAVGD